MSKRLLFDSPASPASRASRGISLALALLAFSLFIYLVFFLLDYHWNWAAVYEYRQKLISGWLTTLWIVAVSLAASLLIGLVAALAKRSTFLPLRYLAQIYIELIRGTPLLVQILFFFYVVADSFGLHNRYLVGIAIMAIFSGAYIAEIFRGGIESVGRSQLLSAKAIGFTRWQTYRHVIFPQALRRSLPALAGQLANLIKDSSLLSIIAISEFTLNAKEINSITYSAFESYLPLALGYLALTLPIMRLATVIEERIRFET